MIKTLPITKARDELAEIVEKAASRLDEYIITVNGVPRAVLMSADEFDSRKETEEILTDKELMRSIKRAKEDIKKGRVYSWEAVKRELNLDV